MLVNLMKLLTIYLSGRLPNVKVARSYEFYDAVSDMEKNAANGIRRIYVLPRRQLGTDTIQSRHPTIEREVGLFVLLLAKTADFSNKTCDPLLMQTEDIRKALWECGTFHLSEPGYETATFMRLDNVTTGIPGMESRLFEAAMIPWFKVHYHKERGA